MSGHGRRLHVFDMDGTLLRGTATIELARHFGKPSIGHEIESRWLAGSISDQEFWQTLLDICVDATEAELDDAFDSACWMTGIVDVFTDIRARGEVAIVVTQSPAFFARRLQRWGASETYGSDVELARPLAPSATLLPQDKVRITKDVLGRHGLTEHACVAYGDSSSDLELFAWLPYAVAVNPSPAVAELASASYVGTDLREAYSIGRRLLSDD